MSFIDSLGEFMNIEYKPSEATKRRAKKELEDAQRRIAEAMPEEKEVRILR